MCLNIDLVHLHRLQFIADAWKRREEIEKKRKEEASKWSHVVAMRVVALWVVWFFICSLARGPRDDLLLLTRESEKTALVISDANARIMGVSMGVSMGLFIPPPHRSLFLEA